MTQLRFMAPNGKPIISMRCQTVGVHSIRPQAAGRDAKGNLAIEFFDYDTTEDELVLTPSGERAFYDTDGEQWPERLVTVEFEPLVKRPYLVDVTISDRMWVSVVASSEQEAARLAAARAERDGWTLFLDNGAPAFEIGQVCAENE